MEENSGDIYHETPQRDRKQRLVFQPEMGVKPADGLPDACQDKHLADTGSLRFQAKNLTLPHALDITIKKKELTCVLRGLQVSYQTQLTTSF